MPKNIDSRGRRRGCSEQQLQAAWLHSAKGRTFISKDKRSVEVISPGIWNVEEGPDFSGARIRVDGEERRGSVEVHRRTSDWRAHGHGGDPAYRDVILHVVGRDDVPEDEVSAEPPVVEIAPKRTGRRMSRAEEFPPGACVRFFSGLSDEDLRRSLRRAGMIRYALKVQALLEEMISQGGDRTFLRHVFDALGYKKNRENFVELFSRLQAHDDAGPGDTEALLWGESGMLPDISAKELDPCMVAYVKSIWDSWWRLRREDLPPIPWHRSGLRPMNMPERRIAAASALLGKFGRRPLESLAAKVLEMKGPEAVSAYLEEFLVCRHPVWDGRINFEHAKEPPSAVLGGERAADIAVNVVLPSLGAYAAISKKKKLKALSEEAWGVFRAPQLNRTTDMAFHRWFMPPDRGASIVADAASHQGVIHLFRTHCERCSYECSECLLLKDLSGAM